MNHPEHNSTLILRSETLSDVHYVNSGDALCDGCATPLSLEGYRLVREIHRKLLPRRPGRDAGLEQTCALYASTSVPGQVCTADSESGASLLVLTPLRRKGEPLPYYHPTVRRLAIRYVAVPGGGILSLEVVLLPDEAALRDGGSPPDPSSRLYRTCLALLDAVHRYGWGALTHYRKRVNHDRMVRREEYQDLYLLLRGRYRHLVDSWRESTDPLKHVFEVSWRTHPISPYVFEER